jgi:hypothetical protein
MTAGIQSRPSVRQKSRAPKTSTAERINSLVEELLSKTKAHPDAPLNEEACEQVARSVMPILESHPPSVGEDISGLLAYCALDRDPAVRQVALTVVQKILYQAPASVQTEVVKACLDRLQRDQKQGTARWLYLAYLLAANYVAVRSFFYRRRLVSLLRTLTRKNRHYSNEPFIADLVLIHDNMRLGYLERLKQRADRSARNLEVS